MAREWCRILVRVLVDVSTYGREASEDKNVHKNRRKVTQESHFSTLFSLALKNDEEKYVFFFLKHHPPHILVAPVL